jgi:RNA chaperone Hfq
VQIGLLKRFKAEGTPLTLRLMGGGEIKGTLQRYDTFVIQFRGDDGITHLLYKHGIVGFSTQSVLDPAHETADETKAA